MGASNINSTRPSTWQRVVVLLVAAGSLAIPATASADPSASGYSRGDAIAQGLEESSQSTGGPSHSSVSSLTGGRTATEFGQAGEPGERGSVSEAPAARSGYSSLNAISGPTPSEPTLVSGPSGTDDGFDWASAAIGAGGVLAVLSLVSAALLTVRRRTGVSPSTASFS